MSTNLLFASIGALAIGLSLVGCPGSLDDEAKYKVDGGGTTPTGCDDAMPIFKASCINAGCHNATDKYSDLDLETPGVVARYKGVKAKGGGGSMYALIDESAPNKSAIYTKTNTPAPFGAVMPLGGTKLSAADQACIASWIAKELESVGPSDSGTTDTGSDDTGPADAGGD